ncbi:MAG: LysM peptidoglycan-binding domain-containing protein [Spirochaetaceae bacterium]|nr:LysM peptidoglycan-binding domain-containing protein [Spirochaetaceae bacterium]
MKWIFCIIAAFFLTCALWAQEENATVEQNSDVQPKISYALLNNDYYKESLKQRSLARLALQEGEYEKSIHHSEEAERYARLSDEYIAKKLLQARVGKAIQEASDKITWAKLNEAGKYYPDELKNAQEHYAAAIDCRNEENMDGALENALAALIDLEAVAAPPKQEPDGKVELPPDTPLNPGQYKVRPWDGFGDCFWNIAKHFYGNPNKWRILYEANKDKLPDPNNPNLIEVGTVIDIPTIAGEDRTGMYDTGRPYSR